MLQKIVLLTCIWILQGCSLFQRSYMEEAEAPPPTAAGPAGEETMAMTGSGQLEAEVAKLNAKVEALETKIEVLQHTAEKNVIRAEQPEIQAVPLRETPSLASSVNEEEGVKQSASAVASPKVARVTTGGRRAEAEFQAAMAAFQKGSYSDATVKFAAVARENHGHLLAAHSLYWAGEASARGKQWSTAAEYWQELEQTYPTSTYMPEALAGLSRAHEQQGNTQKANSYRSLLLRAFPSAPVALHTATEGRGESSQEAQKNSLSVEEPVEPEAPEGEAE